MKRKRKTATAKYVNGLLLLISGLGIGWLIGLSLSPVLHIIVGSIIALVAGAVGSLVGLQKSSDDEAETLQSNSPHYGKHLAPINPLPLTTLVVGLAIGSCLGILARTNDIFGPDPKRFAKKWAGTGLDERIIQQRLFNTLYPPRGFELEPPSKREASEQSQASLDTSKANQGTENLRSENKTDGTGNAPKPNLSGSRQTESGGEVPKQYAAGLYAVSAEDCQLLAGKHGEELRTRLRSLGRPAIDDAAKQCKDNDCLEAIKEKICPRR